MNWRRVRSGQLGVGLRPGQDPVGEKQPQARWGQRWPGCGRAWAEPPTCWVDSDKCPLCGPSISEQLHPGLTDPVRILTVSLASFGVANREDFALLSMTWRQ